MKVVMICEFFNEELDYQEVLLAKYYRRLGCSVTVITTPTRSVHDYIAGRDDGGAVRIEQGEFARVIRVPVLANVAGRIRIFRRLRSIVADEAPDLLYFHDISPNMIELRGYLKRHPACCAIMDYHADYSNSGATRLSRLLLHRLSRRPMLASVRRRLSAILPVVPASRWFLHDLYGIAPDETELLPLGVDTELASAFRTGPARAEVRARLGIGDDALVIFTGGKLVPPKRTEDVLEAVAAIGDPALHVIVVGEARDPAYRAQLERAALGANVHMVGWLDRAGVYRHQAAADLAIFPASQSVLWQQSIGMGLPLVVGEGSADERMRQDVSYMNLAGNIHVLDSHVALPPQITAFVRRCLADRSLLTRMSAGADEVTRRLLGYEHLAQRTLDIAAQHRREVAQETLHA